MPAPTTALSQLLVAYTIHVDNVFESIMVERRHPWIASLPMWANFLRYVDPDGTPLADLHPELVNLRGLKRWRYVDVSPEGVVTPTRGGRHAQNVWARVVERVDASWSWLDLGDLADPPLPHHLPVLGYAFRYRGALPTMPTPDVTVGARLSHALIAATVAYEERSAWALPLMADVVRVIDGPTPIADLPALGGIAKEQVASAVKLLDQRGLATTTSGRRRTITLTAEGLADRDDHTPLLTDVSRGLPDLSGEVARPEVVRALSPRDGWRSRPPYLRQTLRFLDDPARWLPHHPIVSHRGGFPDGS